MQNAFVPSNFSKEDKNMLAHCKEMMEYRNGNVAIHPRHTKLITALRTAQEKGEYVFDKERTSYQHVLDAFRLALTFYN
jgi:maltose-binding protein MalE